MKLAWLFGNTMEQRHLLYVYLSVWTIQGGYCAWIAWHWILSRRDSTVESESPSAPREDF